MLKRLKKFTLQMIAGANVATILLMLLVGYSDRLDPASFPQLANIGLTFPFFLIVNLGFLVFWLLFKKRWMLIPIAGLLVGYQPVRTYCPLNIPRTVAADSTLSLVCFNAYNHEKLETEVFRARVTDFLREQAADLVCLQEFDLNANERTRMADLYPYRDTTRVVRGGDMLTVLSRYPIVRKEHIPNVSYTLTPEAHHSAAFYVAMGSDTVCVINNHLESTNLTVEERSDFKKMMKGDMQKEEVRAESRKLVDRLAESTRVRAPQADGVAAYVDSLLHSPSSHCRSIILCGDLNDGPISYAHRVVGQQLADCFRESGNGPAITYHANAFYVRIDHIFCSADWVPIECFVERKIDFSDHFPLVCRLKKRLNH